MRGERPGSRGVAPSPREAREGFRVITAWGLSFMILGYRV